MLVSVLFRLSAAKVVNLGINGKCGVFVVRWVCVLLVECVVLR